MNDEQRREIEELSRFRYNWKSSTKTRFKKNKEILEQRSAAEIADDIFETISRLIARINPTNIDSLGAIILTLEGARAHARKLSTTK
jgi:hypothetical protein